MQDRFSVYDVFAVLAPGVIFMYLLAFTLDRAVGVKLFNWTGSVGDVALLFVFGYAAGALLQALGKALIESPWLWKVRGASLPRALGGCVSSTASTSTPLKRPSAFLRVAGWWGLGRGTFGDDFEWMPSCDQVLHRPTAQ